MEFIIDFYKNLETLDLIIFWGIIVVIILLLIFTVIVMNKNKKTQKLNNNKFEKNKQDVELPIKENIETNQELTEKKQHETKVNKTNELDNNPLVDLPDIPGMKKVQNEEYIDEPIKTEKKFIAEEHVMEYNKDIFSLPNINKVNNQYIEKTNENNQKNYKNVTMPSGPYQRNVLREMSLGQTSPIGITTANKKEDIKLEMAKDLEESLNSDIDNYLENNNYYNSTKKIENNKINKEETINTKKEEKSATKEQTQYEKNKETSITNNNQYEEKKQYIKINNNTQKIDNNQNKKLPEPTEPSKKSKQDEIKEIIKREMLKVQNNPNRRTEIVNENTENKKKSDISNNLQKEKEEEIIETTSLKKQHELTKELNEYYNIKNYNKTENKNRDRIIIDDKKTTIKTTKEEYKYSKDNIDPRVKELLNSAAIPINPTTKKSSSEKYLEEVSRKLAAAETIDEVERTDYELEQEENAIISYKELMSKKDSIQTIDEEEAVISIEELMNRNKPKEDLKAKSDENTKLYKLTEEEENDDFIKELKQFRNDL